MKTTVKDKKIKVILTLLLTVTITLMTTSYVIASIGEIWTTDSQGNPKSEFDVSDDVYVAGSSLPANTEITIYILDPHLGIAVAGNSVTTDSEGSIPVTLVWSGPLHKITYQDTTIYRVRDYTYEVCVDLDRNGQRDDGDAFNEFTVIYPKSTSEPSPEFHVPEFGTVILMVAMFGALATTYLARKRIH